tara:strand:- start:81 stop:215 length:135 start_codon:yes stop_codon:yes gene_type:complete
MDGTWIVVQPQAAAMLRSRNEASLESVSFLPAGDERFLRIDRDR